MLRTDCVADSHIVSTIYCECNVAIRANGFNVAITFEDWYTGDFFSDHGASWQPEGGNGEIYRISGNQVAGCVSEIIERTEGWPFLFIER